MKSGTSVSRVFGGRTNPVRVDAEFTVKFLYITVYTYRHSNAETWDGACLREIRAETNDNGEAFFVNGTSRNSRFQVETQAGDRTARDASRPSPTGTPNG